jgi:prepilin-type N-terminal cleavage/methylation domain-containing protein
MVRRRGFTLLELMITLTLLAVISAGIALAFGTSLHVFSVVRRGSDVADARRLLARRLEEDLQGAWVRTGSTTTWFRGVSSTPTTEVTLSLPQGNILSLTTARPPSRDAIRLDEGVGGTAGPQSDVQQVSWWLEPAQDGVMELVRRERTPPDAEADETQDVSVTRTVLARGVREVALHFFDGTQWLDQWDVGGEPDTTGTTPGTTTATTDTGLPTMVEVTLQFDPATAGPFVGTISPTAAAAAGSAADPTRWTLRVALPRPVELTIQQATP